MSILPYNPNYEKILLKWKYLHIFIKVTIQLIGSKWLTNCYSALKNTIFISIYGITPISLIVAKEDIVETRFA